MKRIKWFQRSMMIALVGINVLFYCLKKNLDPVFTFTSTATAMVIVLLSILTYVQSRKRRMSKISVVKKPKM